jgi:hypothetical protein
VINAFLKILIKELANSGSEDILKTDFMNEAMLVYAKRKNEIDTLARTFENLNQKEVPGKLNKSSRISPKPKKKLSKGAGNINGYSKLASQSQSKDISARVKMSGMNLNKSNIIPANISNVNRSIYQKKSRMSTHNDSQLSSRLKKSRLTEAN